MRRVLLLGIMLLMASGRAALAQFNVSWDHDCTAGQSPLTDQCGFVGTPLPDGTTVEIYWDQNNNGPDASDDQPIAGGGFGQCNFNSFALNGEGILGCVGGFYTEQLFSINTYTPQPSRYWLRICVPGQSRYWHTNSITVADGYQEIHLTDASWVCVEEACGGCLTPIPVPNFQASENSCSQVTMTWNAYPADQEVDSLFIYRNQNDTLITVLSRTVTSFVYSNAPQGTNNYLIVARRIHAPNTCFSIASLDNGTRLPSSVSPTTCLATENRCGEVIVSWTNPGDVTTVDSFVVFRNGTEIDRQRRLTPGVANADTIPNAGSGTFTVAGWNAQCGNGTPSAGDAGAALSAPPAPTGMTATNGQCAVTIRWNHLEGASNYDVFRDAILISGNQLDTFFVYEPPAAGVNNNYTVSASITTNPGACQDGPVSLAAVGSDIDPPAAPTSVVASDSAFCFHVSVTWTDNSTNELGFVVRRGGINIDTTEMNATSFNDSTALSGVNYSYSVAAFNDCGTSSFAAPNVGSIGRIGAPVFGVNATDNLYDRVTIAWADGFGESAYLVLRDDSLVATVGANVTQYDDFTAVPTVNYLYIVLSVAPCGASQPWSGDYGLIPCEVPPQVQIFHASFGECELALIWDDLSNETYYVIYRDGQWRASVGQDITSFVDDQTNGNTNYVYEVAGVNSCNQGQSSPTSTGFRFSTPQNPIHVNATDSLCGEIVVTWDDVEFEEGYIIRRNGTIAGLASADETSFTVPVGPGRFAFRVQAFNPCGASFNSLADSGSTDVAPSMLSLTASSPDCEGIALTYQASANSDTVKLYRDGNLIAQLLTSNGVYEDTPPPGNYTYSAQAIGDCGVSNETDGVLGNLMEFPSGPSDVSYISDSCATIQVTWVPATGQFGSYRVFRDGAEIAVVPNIQTFYNDAPLPGGVEYVYTVIADNDVCGASAVMDSVVASVVLGSLPAAPEVIITTENLDAVLTWAVVDTTLEGCPVQVSRYLVYFSETGSGPFYYHGSTIETSYRHVEVLRFSPDMFYHVESFVGDVELLLTIPENGGWTREEVRAVAAK